MPPKKCQFQNVNSAQTENKVQKSRKGRRPPKEKPQLKTPTMIRISIPNPKKTFALDTHEPDLPQWNERHIGLEAKINLANQVALAQLVKSEQVEFPPVEPVVKKKRGRKNKVVSTFFQNNTDVPAEEPVPNPVQEPVAEPTNSTKTPKKRKAVSKPKPKVKTEPVPEPIATAKTPKKSKKTPSKSEPKEKPVSRKRTADSTVPKPVKRRKLTPKADKPVIVKNTPTPKFGDNALVTRVLKKRLPKGKHVVDALPAGEMSPSILATFIAPKAEIESDSNLENEPISCCKEVKTNKQKTGTPANAAGAKHSRNIPSSSNSNFSWTKDVSSSSTTTLVTVSTNDIVRFNKKNPMIQLKNIDSIIQNHKNNTINEESSSSDSESSDSEQLSESEVFNDPVGVNTLNLSASSHSNSAVDKNKKIDREKSVDKLVSTLKKIDLEIINWISFENEDVTADLIRLQDKMLDILNSEFGIITHCQHLKEILEPKATENNSLKDNCLPLETNTNEVVFVKPNTFSVPLNNVEVENEPADIKEKVTDNVKESLNDNYTNDESKYVHFDADDDDTLSLFAESITGMDTSRMNSSVASTSTKIQNSEEYVPEPKAKIPEKYNYCPTKISDPNLTKARIVCEKQNADSTSISKEIIDKNDEQLYADVHENIINDNLSEHKVANTHTTPSLLATHFQPIPFYKSVVFKGVCFFNLTNFCKNQSCTFPHVALRSKDVSERLAKISEEVFIQEYISIRHQPALRRMYGLCFVEECVKRDLTTILIEIAMDFLVMANPRSEEDTQLKVNVSEMTLLYLNNVELTGCANILMFEFQKGTMLCDYFMRTIAVSQNFSRFKPVFVKLAWFMVREGRTFGPDVVVHILERVYIFPFERPLARAVIAMMRYTSAKIYENSIIRLFENQISVDTEVMQEYLSIKCAGESRGEQRFSPCSSGVSSPRRALQLDVSRAEEERTPLAPSPDTTNLDNMNKKAEEPIITRTIDLNRSRPCVPPPYSPRPDHNQKVVRKILNWRSEKTSPMMRMPQRQMRPTFTPPRPFRPMRGQPHKRPPERLVTYSSSHLNYKPRWPGPNY